MAAALLYLPANRAFNSNGIGVPGAVAKLYTTGTLTPQNFYSNSGLSVSLGSSITANAAGRFAAAYQDETVPFRLRVEDSHGAELDDIDPYYFGTLVGTVVGTEGAVAASRTELATLSGVAGASAILTEAGREGQFAWSAADNSANVTADASQGVYVAPVTDATGASGAWVRKFDGAYRPEWFGAVGSGAVNDTAAIQAMLTLAAGKTTRLSQSYLVTSAITVSADTVIDARGATITSASTTSVQVFTLGARSKIIGGKFSLTGSSDNPWHFEPAADVSLEGVWLDKTPDAGGYQMYARSGATNFSMRNCRTSGSNGIYIEGSGSSFIGNRFVGRATGGDDALAIKGIAGFTRNIRIEGNYFENLAAGVSIGSEIGTSAANDATYSKGVGQVVFVGNTLKNCANIAYIKPGGISSVDYRDGTVEGVVISNNTLTDETGVKFDRGIAITPARGARVRQVYGRNNVIRARTVSGAGRPIGALDIYILDYAGGTTDATAQNINVEVDFRDIYDGLSNSGARPGYPAQIIASVNRLGAVGTVSDIVINIRGSGSSEAGFVVGLGMGANTVRVENLQLTNVNQTNAAGQGGAYLLSDVYLGVGYWSVTPAFGTEMAGAGVLTGTLSVARGGTGGGTASGTLVDNISGFASTGQIARTAAGTYAFRTLTAPAAGITVSNGSGVAGNPTIALANDLAAIEALSGTNTLYYRSGTDAWSAVTVGPTLSFSGGTLKKAVSGAMVKKAADLIGTDLSAGVSVAFDAEVYDTGGFHDNVTNNSRLTTVSGNAYVRVGATITFANVTIGTDLTAVIRRNGVTSYDGTLQTQIDVATTAPCVNICSGPIAVTGGTDYFELFVFMVTDTSVDVTAARTNFWLEVLE